MAVTTTNGSDIAEVEEMIQSLYRCVNSPPVLHGGMDDGVAAVFSTMIAEARTCSHALGWVRQLGHGVFNASRGRLSSTCARAVIYKWQIALEMASMGIAMKKVPKWA